MANPVPAVEEAASAMDGWQPENGRELYAALNAMSPVLDKLAEVTRALFGSENEKLAESVTEAADEAASSLGAASEHIEGAAAEFRSAYAFWLEEGE